MDEKLKQLNYKAANRVDRSTTKSCVPELGYNVDKAESSNAQVRINAGTKRKKISNELSM